MPDRFGAIPEVHLFLLNDDRLLLLRRCNTDYENGNYSVIAGGVEADEEVTAAAIREATEEAGIDIRPADIDVVGVMHRKGADGVVSVVFFLTARAWGGEIVNAEPWNHDEVSWHSVDNLQENMIAYVRAAFTNYRQGRFYDTVGWDDTVPVQPNPSYRPTRRSPTQRSEERRRRSGSRFIAQTSQWPGSCTGDLPTAEFRSFSPHPRGPATSRAPKHTRAMTCRGTLSTTCRRTRSLTSDKL